MPVGRILSLEIIDMHEARMRIEEQRIVSELARIGRDGVHVPEPLVPRTRRAVVVD
ncbi:hypothetical protein [Micromonospora sp. KC213]|uniref:hypothetical protein n=1 Tax=Micromonospora sp. KC213 TaxID=2530378 RepID=UPI001FB5EEFE|nr:hypothetical protein [Micromonospora sp. KC213]